MGQEVVAISDMGHPAAKLVTQGRVSSFFVAVEASGLYNRSRWDHHKA